MQNTHLWRKLDIRGYKTLILLILIAFIAPTQLNAQWVGHQKEKSLYTQQADQHLFRKNRLKNRLNFGFQLALMRSNLTPTYSDSYLATANAGGLQNIYALPSPGFVIGGYSSYRVKDLFDIRVHFNFFASYERRLQYDYIGTKKPELKSVEASMFEIPILIKYRAQIRGISNMYLVAGIKPSFSLSQKSEDQERVLLLNQDLTIEYGFGFDVFFPYFKFAPEIRFSHGIINVLQVKNDNFYTNQLKRLTSHTATLYFHFGG